MTTTHSYFQHWLINAQNNSDDTIILKLKNPHQTILIQTYKRVAGQEKESPHIHKGIIIHYHFPKRLQIPSQLPLSLTHILACRTKIMDYIAQASLVESINVIVSDSVEDKEEANLEQWFKAIKGWERNHMLSGNRRLVGLLSITLAIACETLRM